MEAGELWNARVGDEVSVESHRVHGARRVGAIVELLGSPDHPYYRVCWQDGRETVFHPGSDAELHPKGDRRPRRTRRPSAATARQTTPEPAATAPAPREGLRASAGDRLVIKGHRLGEPSRDGEILEVLGDDGSPPFRIRWSDSGREVVLFPGLDAVVDHFPGRDAQAGGRSARKGG
jgi:hypothetical protein